MNEACRDKGFDLYDRGFALRDWGAGAILFGFLGMLLGGSARSLRHAAKRCWRLFLALQHLLSARGCQRRVLEVAVEHLVHNFSPNTPALSVLEQVYSATALATTGVLSGASVGA